MTLMDGGYMEDNLKLYRISVEFSDSRGSRPALSLLTDPMGLFSGSGGARTRRESYFEVATSEREAAKKFRERTKTGSNPHSGHITDCHYKNDSSMAVLSDFIYSVPRMYLSRYYRGFEEDEAVVEFLKKKEEDSQ